MRPKAPRAICFEIMQKVEKTDRPLDTLLTDSFKRYRHLTGLDRAFLTELAYGILRWRGKLDWIIACFSKLPFQRIEPEVLHLLRMGLYQVLYLSRTPVSAAVNESVELAKKARGQGGAAFVNGLLREVLRQKEEIRFPGCDEDPVLHLSVVHSHPPWLVRRWVGEFGMEETLNICMAGNERAPLTLRANGLKIRRDDLRKRLTQQKLEAIPTVYSEEGILLNSPPPTSELPFAREGLFMIQDEASQLVTRVLDPRPGERVLDACAAPGGKTTHIAQRMRNEGKIYALDVSKEKLNALERLCAEFGVKIVNTRKADASRSLPLPEGLTFDRILADAPCSGFGTLRRNPDLRWRKGESDVLRLSGVQAAILGNLAGYVRPGGTLVYSTCTVFREENEDVVEGFLGEHPEFRVDPIGEGLPEPCLRFITNGYLKTFPRGDTMDGFFVAAMVKKYETA